MGLLKITFDDARVTSKDDADYYHHLAGKKNGVLDGILGKCVPSVSNSNISFQSGYVQVYGRRVYVESGTRMAITLDGNAKGYVYIKYDLGNNAATLEKKESSNFPTLREDDLMNGGLIYEFPLAKYQKTASSLTLVDGWSAPKIRILEELITEAEGRVTTIANAAQSAANSAQTTANTALNYVNHMVMKFTHQFQYLIDFSTYDPVTNVTFNLGNTVDANSIIQIVFTVSDIDGYGGQTQVLGSLFIQYYSLQWAKYTARIMTSNGGEMTVTITSPQYESNNILNINVPNTSGRPNIVTVDVLKPGVQL